ncbi:MAG: EAL domain-containing protein [Halanaerobacter sp.]
MTNKLRDDLIDDELERGIIVANKVGDIVGVNSYAAEFFEVDLSELMNYNLDYFFPDASSVELSKLKQQGIVNLEVEIAGEEAVTIYSKINLFYLEDQELYEFNFVRFEDASLRDRVELITKFPEKNPNPVLKISNTGELLYSNPRGESIASKLKDENNHFSLDWNDFVSRFINQGEHVGKIEINNQTFLFQSVFLHHEQSIHLYGRNISKLTARKEDIESLLNSDFLTGLPTRNLFSQKLKENLEKADKYDDLVAVLFLDLDNFKKVNDSLGHAMGDRLLSKVAKKLLNFFSNDVILARLSGDEFGAIINDLNTIPEVSELLEELISEFKNPFNIMNPEGYENEIYMTLSVGAAVYPNDSQSFEQLIKKSETAKNKVKENGKNHYRFYSDEMNKEALQDLELEAKLRHAIDNDEFILYYQPQIDLNTNQVFGVEALIRWEDEELGLISPGKFIPLAERTGLIMPIGDWVLEEACREAKEFHKMGFPDLKMGINLSARQFADENLVEKISDILSQTGLNPTKLELEITESIIMKDVKKNVKKLVKLKKLGVKFSVDDFGTGYSSLSYLKEFPIGTLKIDRSFVDQLPSDKDDIAIVKSIIDLAHNLNLNVIAEGVENTEHLEFLEENHCDRIQGYYFGRPMSRDELIEFLNKEPWKKADWEGE